jgi:hypothetical protein
MINLEILDSARFKDVIGAIDGTHIRIIVA